MNNFSNTQQTPNPPFPQLDGIFILNKPAGITSAKCLNIFKKLGQKKIGHAGTLDPMATGCLIVLLGQATKLASHLLSGGEKIYSGWLRLGLETDTWDKTGKIVAEHNIHVTASEVAAAISHWQDETSQEVPEYSSAKFKGQPLYKLARKGQPVPKKYKPIHISKASMLSINMPFVHFRVRCSSGSYIRSLAHSLGKRLGCGATLYELTREYSHPYDLNGACNLSELEAEPHRLPKLLKTLTSALPHWPALNLDAASAALLKNGRPVPATGNLDWQQANSDRAILLHVEQPLALASLDRQTSPPSWKIMRGLWS